MKKLTVILFLLLAVNSINSQTQNTLTINSEINSGEKVPSIVLNQFKMDYPNQQPIWNMDGDYYRASFVNSTQMNGHAAAYNKNGHVIYREEQLAKGDYPVEIVKYYNKNFPNDKYEIWSNTDKTGIRSYYTNHNKEILWFDEKGNYRNKSKIK